MIKNWRTHIRGAEFKVMRLQAAAIATELDTLDTPQSVQNYLMPKLRESLVYRPDVENFMVVHLNTRKRAIGWEVTTTGTPDTLLVHPREVFRSAILMNAAAIILCHNHPSGEPSPSEADIKITRELIRNGQFLKIEVVDHIILGQPTLSRSKPFSSLREMGYFL